ncbi:hypothetical protein [Agrobacterium tumefaciens]|uniref:hypothetical protein n=1 Tax=Agrobacterium tumefaciens TaxID=358 RepID=UPI0021D22457|nr:hypothetical protein [Agrobacterium tumefaciens]UXS01125.1 hypothetical protein FY156_06280 [Agrobacterium tumefaciens]
MIARAKAWAKERTSGIILTTATALVVLSIFTGWIIDAVLGFFVLLLLRLALHLNKR